MKRIRSRLFMIVAVLVAAVPLGSCGPSTTQGLGSTPAMISPEPGSGAVSGVIANLSDFWQRGPVYVFAAEYHGDEQGQGIYVLEPSIHPNTTVQHGGVFQINNMPPGDYVLIIGPTPEEAVVVRDNGDARIIHVPAGEVTEVGSIELRW